MRTIDKRGKVTRRRFLQTGAAAAAGAAAISGGTLVLDPNGAWAMTVKTLRPETMATLVRVARDIFPHDRIGGAFYAKAVAPYDEAAGKDPAVQKLIEGGIADLEQGAKAKYGTGYAAVNAENDRVALLRSMEATPFFKKVRGDLVVSLYNQKDIWPRFGYEGESASLGGYMDRGFSDIDWIKDA
jgi:hypothetical protein